MIYWLLVLCLVASPVEAAVLWFAGSETGDTSEFTQISAGGGTSTPTGSPSPATGNYSFGTSQLAVNPGFGISKKGLGLSTAFVRAYFQIDGTPTEDQIVYEPLNSSQALSLRLWIKTNKTLYFNFNAGRGTSIIASGATVLAINTWYRIETKWVNSATVGGLEVLIDGVSEMSSFVTNTSGQGNFDQFIFGPSQGCVGACSGHQFYDNLAISDSGYLGVGGSIARQGTSGTPTYTSWTKNSCTSSLIENCWSNTPFTTGSNASTATASNAQTMLVASFGSTQTGHGTETIAPHDTINACKAAGIIKSGTASAPLSIRRRLDGTDTDTAKTLTTSDAYYDDGIWTTTTDILRTNTLMEVGALHGTGTATDTVEDMWIICDFQAVIVPVVHRVTQ